MTGGHFIVLFYLRSRTGLWLPLLESSTTFDDGFVAIFSSYKVLMGAVKRKFARPQFCISSAFGFTAKKREKKKGRSMRQKVPSPPHANFPFHHEVQKITWKIVWLHAYLSSQRRTVINCWVRDENAA